MPRKLIVHIGLVKTGSTSIQRMLYALRSALERLGIQIPSAECPPRLCCHNDIGHSLSRGANYRPNLGGWAEFREEIANCTLPTTLVSAEAFTTDRAYVESNARFARDFGIDNAGLLFRDPVTTRVNKPNPADWSDLSPREKRTGSRYVRGVAGIDLAIVGAGQATSSVPPDPLPPMSTLKKWWLRPRVARAWRRQYSLGQ